MRSLIVDIETTYNNNIWAETWEKAQELHAAKKRRSDWEEADVKKAMALNALYGRIAAIGVSEFPNNSSREIFCDMDERFMLAQFWEYVRGADLIVTFNGIEFDVPYLKKRSALLGVTELMDIDTRKYYIGNHVDLFQLINNWQRDYEEKISTKLEDLGPVVEAVTGIPMPKLEADCGAALVPELFWAQVAFEDGMKEAAAMVGDKAFDPPLTGAPFDFIKAHLTNDLKRTEHLWLALDLPGHPDTRAKHEVPF